jgi:hypothetical protein
MDTGMTPLQQAQQEARDEFLKDCTNQNCEACIRDGKLLDSLTRRAYLLGVEECEKAAKEKRDWYGKEKVENLQRENVMIAYDMDSRWVAAKQILKALELLRDERV